jgi:D-glycero-alpha-D-manno-heptose 1-phosphate guanylyltransferase
MNNISEAIILVGGLGKRLYPLTMDCPKPMVLINNKPFLQYILDYINSYNITKVILSVGYKHEHILNYFGHSYKNITIIYSYDEEPLGTGGAIKKALSLVENETVYILNGDSFFNIDLFKFSSFQIIGTKIIIALKKVLDTKRYGIVITDEKRNIKSFSEKKGNMGSGYINSGIYLLNKNLFSDYKENIFSFESFLETYCCKDTCKGIAFDDAYFIDIGIPQDYAKAQVDFKELF